MLFLATVAIVGIVYLAQWEIPRPDYMEPGTYDDYLTYGDVLGIIGPRGAFALLLMYGCIVRAVFSRKIHFSTRNVFFCVLPMLAGYAEVFINLSGLIASVNTVGIRLDGDVLGRMYAVECKLLLLVGALSSGLCFLITWLRKKNIGEETPEP